MLLISAALSAADSGLVRGSDVHLAVGLGYEFVSQEYFLDSLTESGQDSLTATTALKTTYLDDVKAGLNLKYRPFETPALVFGAGYEQASDVMRARFLADCSPKIGSGRLDIGSELDWRATYSGKSEAGDDYLYGRLRTKLTLPLGPSTSVRWQARADFVSFDSASDFSRDHFHLGGKAGVAMTLPDLSMFDIDLFVLARQVPDSGVLDYLSFGVEGVYLGFHSRGDLDLLGRLERRDYSQGDGPEDYWRGELASRSMIRLGSTYFSRQEADLELNLFSGPNLASYDYARLGLTALAGFESGELSFGIGGDFEFQAELSNQLGTGDNYFEAGIHTEIGYSRPGGVFGSLESVVGHRNLENESDLRTSFDYERLSLIAGGGLYGSISLSVLFSAEWEWHENDEENSRAVLLSAALSYAL